MDAENEISEVPMSQTPVKTELVIKSRLSPSSYAIDIIEIFIFIFVFFFESSRNSTF